MCLSSEPSYQLETEKNSIAQFLKKACFSEISFYE